MRKIDWDKVWKALDRWNYSHPVCRKEEARNHVEKLVEAQLRDKK